MPRDIMQRMSWDCTQKSQKVGDAKPSQPVKEVPPAPRTSVSAIADTVVFHNPELLFG